MRSFVVAIGFLHVGFLSGRTEGRIWPETTTWIRAAKDQKKMERTGEPIRQSERVEKLTTIKVICRRAEDQTVSVETAEVEMVRSC